MEKSPEAFRTISEVAEWLGTPTHVLRFWESRFTQVKPVKRAGGRRYYRPADMALLGGIKKLLHEDGMTIRGVQKLLREKGVKHVAAMAPPLDGEDVAPFQADVEPESETAEVVALRPAAPDTAPSAEPADAERRRKRRPRPRPRRPRRQKKHRPPRPRPRRSPPPRPRPRRSRQR
jgi:DNA-binding transcriptional MerR regulator